MGIFVRLKDFDKSAWEYIKLISQKSHKTTSALIEEMVELHAITRIEKAYLPCLETNLKMTKSLVTMGNLKTRTNE